MTTIDELGQRVTIQKPVTTPDGRGGIVKGWADVATVWAKVRPDTGREVAAGGKVEAVEVYYVVIYRRTDVTADCRLVWKGMVMNIRSVPVTGSRAMWTTIKCEAGVSS